MKAYDLKFRFAGLFYDGNELIEQLKKPIVGVAASLEVSQRRRDQKTILTTSLKSLLFIRQLRSRVKQSSVSVIANVRFSRSRKLLLLFLKAACRHSLDKVTE